MDSITLTAIIATIIAVIVAGVGIFIAFRSVGYFQYLGGNRQGQVPPVGKRTLILTLMTLNDAAKPYQIVQGTESDLVAGWKIADATWYGIFNKNKLKTAYQAFLLIDEQRHSVRCYEEYNSITWSVGTLGPEPFVNYQKSFFGGRILFKKTIGIGYGFQATDPRSAGKVYEYRFDINEIRDPIITTVVANGWEWVPVTGKRNATYPPGKDPDQADTEIEDSFCMSCGGRLDERTKRCPRCDPPLAIPEEKSPVSSEKKIPVMPPTPSVGMQANGPLSSLPSPSLPSSKIPVKKLAIGLVILFTVLILAVFISGLFKLPAEKSVIPTIIPLNPAVTPETTYTNPVPSPTDMVPQGTEVSVQVVKSPINQEISVIFSGGPGQKVLKELEIRVSRSDGSVLMTNLIPYQQSEATISGSKGDDRVEVFAIYYSGQKYRIFDDIMKKRIIV